MKSVVIDTNIVLSFVTDRDERQQQAALRLFEGAAAGTLRLVVPQVVLVEIVYVLENLYRHPASEVAGVIRDLLSMPHVAVENEVPWRAVRALWPRRVRDFAGGVLVAVAKAGGHLVASFDRRLNGSLRRLAVTAHRLR